MHANDDIVPEITNRAKEVDVTNVEKVSDHGNVPAHFEGGRFGGLPGK